MIRRHVLAVLLALVALLLLALLALWVNSSGALRHMRWQPPAPQIFDYAATVPALPDPAAADTRRFVALLERPLFSPTRRPPPPVPKEDAPANDVMASARLTGLFEGAGDGGVIVLLDGKPRRVRLHEAVEGWQLTAVVSVVVSAAQSVLRASGSEPAPFDVLLDRCPASLATVRRPSGRTGPPGSAGRSLLPRAGGV